MAKAKKAKNNEEQKGGTDDSSNSEAIVKHQKLCLSIDMENRRIYGYTELQMVVPENGIVGLYADNLAIERVTVDGEPAVFENYPHYEHREPKDWAVVSSATSAADASGSVYLSSLDFELLPNLLIMCSQSSKPDNKQQECMDMENGEQLSADQSRLTLVQNVRHVRIEYWVEKAETGIHFDDDVLHTDSQLRRARCWFPCMDDSFQCCCYDLEFTVASNLVAISSGTLVHQVLTNESPPRKTYVYKLDVPVAAQWISLAVAPVEIVSDRHGGQLSHFCQPANLPKLRNTVVFFYNAFSHYEDYLSASFPFGSYRQVFISPEMALSSCSVGASMSIFSSHLLFDEKIIDQTIETRTKLAYALARQWFGVYITPEAPNDEWLLDGLAGFLTDSFIKRSLGNNEARYRRYKANCAVCQADDSGATALSSSAASKDLYGTQCIGFYGKIRSWKSVAVLQMLEKQMGPESFRKILQTIILRARDGNRPLRTLSTKEFRHFANKIGNLERPFLKEFFPRWIESCGCPVLKMGFSFNKRKNLVELAVHRDCTFRPDTRAGIVNHTSDSENHETGWPGMMSIRVHELDGMYDHPILPMAGEPWQLLEIQCHSKLAAKRVQKPKKGTKADGSDDNAEAATTDLRLNSDSPLMWLRADPEMEYLAEVHFNQPTQMWINQLEKDKDVIAQAQVISVLESLPQLTFSVVNALNNFLRDSKAFWRVRVQAAYALATTTTEDTDWAGLLHLINFYKSRRFDPNIGLPRPNDFHDIQEYFVLEAIPHAIALVRHSDNKSPREAVEFILQLLKYNDNNGNTYSDVFWLAALVRAVGELEFGLQSIVHLPSLLKRLDRLLQFDRLMPSHNGILTVSCIRTLTQIALKLSEFVPLDSVINLIKPYRGSKTWQIRIDASRALLELEFQSKGINAALSLFIRYLKDDMCIRGQTKLGVCALRLSQMDSPSNNGNDVQSETLVALLRELESPIAFNNITLRHYIFCILQVLAGRPPTLFGVPRDEMGHSNTSSELKSFFAAVIKQKSMADGSPALAPDLNTQTLLISEGDGKVEAHTENNNVPGAAISPVKDASVIPGAALSPVKDASVIPGAALSPVKDASVIPGAALSPVKDASVIPGAALSPVKDASVIPVAESIPDSHIETNLLPLVPVDVPVMPPVDVPVMPPKGPQGREPVEQQTSILVDNSNNVEASVKEEREPMIDLVRDGLLTGGSTREIGTVTNGNEVVKKPPKLKIRVKQSAQVSNDTTRIMSTHDRPNDGADHGESSSVSVTASRRNFGDNIAHNLEDANSGHDIGSRLTASIGSAKPTADEDELLQCTADSSKVSLQNTINDTEPQTSGHTYTASVEIKTEEGQERSKSGKEKRKDKERKRKRSDKTNEADDSERKRQKKEKKRKKKELAKLMATSKPDNVASVNLPIQVDPQARPNPQQREQPLEIRGDATHGDVAAPSVDELHRSRDPGGVQVKAAEPVQPNVGEPASASSAQNTAPSHKIKIKFKSRTLGKP